jgi:hypothetical protein
MNILGLLYSASIALIITIVFANALRIKGPWGNFWTFFILLLLAALAANFWIEPIGPNYQGVYWLPPIAAVLLIAFLLAASSPPPEPRNILEQQSQEYIEKKASALAVGIFFWFVVTFMLILVLIGLFNTV